MIKTSKFKRRFRPHYVGMRGCAGGGAAGGGAAGAAGAVSGARGWRRIYWRRIYINNARARILRQNKQSINLLKIWRKFCPSEPRPALILLSGGASRRFGSDKMQHINSHRVWRFGALARRMSAVFTLYECAKTPHNLPHTRAIIDHSKEFGAACALSAIAECIERKTLAHRWIFILAGDYFAARPKALFTLLRPLKFRKNRRYSEIACSTNFAKTPNFPKNRRYSEIARSKIIAKHPLFALYSRADLAAAKHLAPNSRINEFASRINAQTIFAGKLMARSLVNFNRPHEKTPR